MKHCNGCHAEIADDLEDCGKHDERQTPQAAREVSTSTPIRPPAGKRLMQSTAKVLEKVGHVALQAAEAGAEIGLNSQVEF